MHCGSLLQRATERSVRVFVLGAGDYGRSLIFQARRGPGLQIGAVCDSRVETALAALRAAGFEEEQILILPEIGAARRGLEAGKVLVVDDPLMLMELPAEVVVEATGSPEAGAAHAEAAIRSGKHVVMVSKEADSAVGALLHARARAAGLVYTPVDGDQPALLMQLVLWARLIGLRVLCAAKTSEYDFVWDPDKDEVRCLDQKIGAPDFSALWSMDGRSAADIMAARSRMLSEIPQHTVADLTEMAIVANALGLDVDHSDLHAPICRAGEVPDVLAPRDFGGLLDSEGNVDVVNLLRRPDEFSLAGGVFVTVACEDARTWELLRGKGHVVSRNGRVGLVVQPFHLLGVQSATTILLAAHEKRSSGSGEILPRYDVVGRATASLKAGTRLEPQGSHHQIPGVQGSLRPAVPVAARRPIPFHMMAGRTLVADVAAGEIITVDKVETPADSRLWALRAEMDKAFLAPAPRRGPAAPG